MISIVHSRAQASYSVRWKGKSFPLPSTDSQRERLYRAERAVFTERPIDFKTRKGLEGRVNRLARSATARKLRAEFGLPLKGPITVQLVRGRTCTSYGGLITFAKTSMSEWVMLHELAHELAPRAVHHHWPFAYIYLKLVSRFMGPEVAAKLKKSFREHGVRFAPKRTRTLTPEQREACRERLKGAREARAAKKALFGRHLRGVTVLSINGVPVSGRITKITFAPRPASEA